MQRMKMGFRNLGVLFAIVLGLTLSATLASAQQSTSEPADTENFEQVQLTDAQVKGYIAAAPKLTELFDKIDQAGNNPDAKLDAELEATAKKNGFKNYDELETVGSNISFVMSGINEEGDTFREPLEVLQEELAAVEADASIAAEEKAQLIASIKESISLTPKLQFPDNAKIVQTHFKALSDLFQ